MRLEGEGKLLRLFIGESDTWRGKPLYQAIVERGEEVADNRLEMPGAGAQLELLVQAAYAPFERELDRVLLLLEAREAEGGDHVGAQHLLLDNLTPADVYFGRGPTVLAERERIKRQTIANRRLQHRLQAA